MKIHTLHMNLLQTSNGLCKRYQFITLQSLGNTSKLIIILYTVPFVLSRTYRNRISLITIYCGSEPEQHWMYYLCTDFATFSKWHYIIVQKQGAEGWHEHISECIEISVIQSVLEWLVSHNLFYRNITLDKRFVIAIL